MGVRCCGLHTHRHDGTLAGLGSLTQELEAGAYHLEQSDVNCKLIVD